jgi:hypothetical protein
MRMKVEVRAYDAHDDRSDYAWQATMFWGVNEASTYVSYGNNPYDALLSLVEHVGGAHETLVDAIRKAL